MTTQFMIRPLRWLWRLVSVIPVDMAEGRERDSIRRASEALKAGCVVGIFPEGGLNPDRAAGLQPFQRGVALIARRAGDVPIVPVRVSGTPRIAGVWLPFLVPGRARVRFGRPFHLADLGRPDEDTAGKPSLAWQAERMRDRLAALAPRSEGDVDVPAEAARKAGASAEPSIDPNAGRP